MALGLIGKKVGMTRLFDQESGAMVPVTVIDVKGNTFAQIKTEDKDGYNAIQVAFDAQKESRVAKPQVGHFKKLGIQPTKLLKEFRVEASELPAEGAEDPGVDLFSAGQWVDVIGTSKGKGFQGAMRRHNFHGSAKRTVQNLKVVAVRPEDNVILISGSVPGARGSYLVIRPAKKK